MRFANGVSLSLDPTRPLVVLSHGMGQDSAGIMALLTDPKRADFYQNFVGDAQLIVLHADTGAEHDRTVAYRDVVRAQCAEHNIPFLVITGDLGYHSGDWAHGLWGQWDAHGTINSVAFGASCSDSLKITPIWKVVNDLLADAYGIDAHGKVSTHPKGRAGLYTHLARHEKPVDCLIGIARGEERRIAGGATCSAQMLFTDDQLPKQKPALAKWFQACVRRRYPLIDVGYDRLDIHAYLTALGLPIPIPSLCKTCHFSDEAKVLHLARTEPDVFARWVASEQRKFAEHPAPAGKPNYGAKGTIALPAFLARAEKMYGHLTTDQLEQHVLTHGQSVRNNF